MANESDVITKERFMADHPDHITTERVYDIVRDQLVALNEKQREFGAVKAQAQGFDALAAPLTAPGVLTGPLIMAPPTCDAVPSPALARQWRLDKHVTTLQEANRIRRDEALMREIRMYLRMKKEEAANLIDEIG